MRAPGRCPAACGPPRGDLVGEATRHLTGDALGDRPAGQAHAGAVLVHHRVTAERGGVHADERRRLVESTEFQNSRVRHPSAEARSLFFGRTNPRIRRAASKSVLPRTWRDASVSLNSSSSSARNASTSDHGATRQPGLTHSCRPASSPSRNRTWIQSDPATAANPNDLHLPDGAAQLLRPRTVCPVLANLHAPIEPGPLVSLLGNRRNCWSGRPRRVDAAPRRHRG